MITRPAGDTSSLAAATHGCCVRCSTTRAASTVTSRCPTRRPLRARMSSVDTRLVPVIVMSDTVKKEDCRNAAAASSIAITAAKRSSWRPGAGGWATCGRSRTGGLRGYAATCVCVMRCDEGALNVSTVCWFRCLPYSKFSQQFDLRFQLDPELLRDQRVYLVHQGQHVGRGRLSGVHDVIGMNLGHLGRPNLQPLAAGEVDQPAGVVPRGIAEDAAGAGGADRLSGGAMRQPLVGAPPNHVGVLRCSCNVASITTAARCCRTLVRYA